MSDKVLNNKKIFPVIGIILIVCTSIIGISFVYASVTSKLTINGYASMNPSKWSIYFKNLSDANLKGTTIEVSKPTIQNNSTSISDFDINFINGMDGVSYTFDVVNDGSLDAKISSIVIPKPICIGTGENSFEDSNLICDNLTYNLTYIDGSKIQPGDTLDKGQTKSFILNLEYSNTELPKNKVEISGLSITLIYVQK